MGELLIPTIVSPVAWQIRARLSMNIKISWNMRQRVIFREIHLISLLIVDVGGRGGHLCFWPLGRSSQKLLHIYIYKHNTYILGRRHDTFPSISL